MCRLFLGRSLGGSSLSRLSGLLALLAAASGFALCLLAVRAALAFAFAAALTCFLALFALLAASLGLSGSVLLVAVTAATYHCNGSDQNNE